ncbi:MAG TPA: class I SAM-dependent methyltransferase [Draconibacterium sp.]|nr:class I SAM-dependent methyltransferase [Draconibacterium sp.]
MVESGIFYGAVIDPVLSPMRKRVNCEINPGEKVIDIACGTGAQVFELCGIASKIVGIDLSESMINHAQNSVKKRNILNVEFFVCDATNLSRFEANSYDVAVMSLALHQFAPGLHSTILSEMKRVAKRIIIVDYAVPLPKNYAGIGCRVAEFLAGKEHHRNFRKYYQLGGLKMILPENNLKIEKSVLFGKGAFQLVVC